MENKIEYPIFNILRPHRGTRLADRLMKEGRVKESDLEVLTTLKAHFEPLQMSRVELEEGCEQAWRVVYSKKAMKKRLSHIMTGSSLFKKGPRSGSDGGVGPWKRNLSKEDLIVLMNMNTHYYFT